MNLIVAVSRTWGIGRGNDLLFHIPEDMKFFRSVTAGHTLVLGRKNLESFPGGRPLKNRRHLVLTTNREYPAPEGVELFFSLQELLAALKDIPEEELWVSGGGVVYRELLPYCRKALVTWVDADPACEVYFPDLTAEPGWKLTAEEEWKEYEGLRFRFTTWENEAPLPIE